MGSAICKYSFSINFDTPIQIRINNYTLIPDIIMLILLLLIFLLFILFRLIKLAETSRMHYIIQHLSKDFLCTTEHLTS
jgi:sorbitol-specific phosphotransferase system component IIC